MWHKKWCLPRIHIRVERTDGLPLSATDKLSVIVFSGLFDKVHYALAMATAAAAVGRPVTTRGPQRCCAPPSIERCSAVMNRASSESRKATASAISSASA